MFNSAIEHLFLARTLLALSAIMRFSDSTSKTTALLIAALERSLKRSSPITMS